MILWCHTPHQYPQSHLDLHSTAFTADTLGWLLQVVAERCSTGKALTAKLSVAPKFSFRKKQETICHSFPRKHQCTLLRED